MCVVLLNRPRAVPAMVLMCVCECECVCVNVNVWNFFLNYWPIINDCNESKNSFGAHFEKIHNLSRDKWDSMELI